MHYDEAEEERLHEEAFDKLLAKEITFDQWSLYNWIRWYHRRGRRDALAKYIEAMKREDGRMLADTARANLDALRAQGMITGDLHDVI
jgi:hypothetical protein